MARYGLSRSLPVLPVQPANAGSIRVRSMFGPRPKLPVTAEQQEWIEQSFLLLSSLFGAERGRQAKLVLPNEQFFPRKWEPTEAWAQFAFECVCDLMRVPRKRAQLMFVEDPWAELRKSGVNIGRTKDAAGSYAEIQLEEGKSLAQILIKRSLLDEPEVMTAVMAHELAHVLLLGDGKISRDLEKMEPLTDLMTVFCGFGVLNANAAHVHKSGPGGWSISQIGYLSPREYGYSLALFAWNKGDPDPRWDKELTKNVRHFMRASLGCFKASKRSIFR